LLVPQESMRSDAGRDGGASRNEVAITTTIVWQCLESTFHLPADIINALFTGLAQTLGESAALRLFEADWMRDMHERWLPFAGIVAARRPLDETAPTLPVVYDEFKTLLFAVQRNALAQIDAGDPHQSVEARLATLANQGFALRTSSGDDNNCLIHSLATVLAQAGYINFPPARRGVFQAVRQCLIATPGLHPLTGYGRKCKTAYLEHRIHADAVVRMLVRDFGERFLPEAGFELIIHARYDVEGLCPPDSIPVGKRPAGSASVGGAAQRLQVFNWTGLGTSGFHYDALTPDQLLG
jgi:hypothetical protein